MGYLKYVATLCIVVFFPLYSLASDAKKTTEWQQLSYDVTFSIRCSKGPRVSTLGDHKTYWYDFIYLKWDDEELTRLSYSAAVDSPHNWYGGENPATYKISKFGGHSEVTVNSQSRMFDGEKIKQFKISLDASKESKLSAFNVNAVTFGVWVVSVVDNDVSFTESTSNFSNGKLSSSDSSSWESCRLMTPYGDDF